ncbi:hypothetical protein DB48_00030 [Shewanella sp. cp20]|nr:hypothetical protein DB48_00030 [Shewanella sp. cp20]
MEHTEHGEHRQKNKCFLNNELYAQDVIYITLQSLRCFICQLKTVKYPIITNKQVTTRNQ